MPEQVSSAGRAFGERQALEDEYTRLAEGSVRSFLQGVRDGAVAGTLSLLSVNSQWQALLDDLEARGASGTLIEALQESNLPGDAFEAVNFALAESQGQSTSAVKTMLMATLGLITVKALATPGAEPGKLLTADGALSWEAVSKGAARTAATADFGREMVADAKAEGYTHKRWSTRYDDRVRDTHVHADRQTVLIDEDFVVGGELLSYPADPRGTPAETYNCRCVLILVKFGDRPWDYPEGVEPWNNPRPF